MIYNLLETYEPYVPPTWAGGTDEEIVEALEKHYAGKIDLTEYWSVGDERVVSLSAMSATGVGESHVAQDVTMVIMNVGGKTLAGGGECAFIVGQKGVLGTGNEDGYMNTQTAYANGGWNACARRTWCNNIYYNAFPSTLRPIFKQHINKTSSDSATITDSVDYFALPARTEVTGNGEVSERLVLSQFEYYVDSTNRVKNNKYWWLRSVYSYSGSQFDDIKYNGAEDYSLSWNSNGISPFGCI